MKIIAAVSGENSVYKGRPATIDAAQVRAMKAQGLGASEIAKALKIGRASVYRVLEAS
jgi:DNA invertase Pin-like site-specific DNA recombinase